MERLLTRHAETLYALLRILSGAAFSCHGLQKIFGLLAGEPARLYSQMWFGGWIELLAGALICVGLFTRGAALLASGTMAVAYIQFHWKGQLDAHFFPVVNEGELAFLYCFLFLYVAAKGAGRLGVDRQRR